MKQLILAMAVMLAACSTDKTPQPSAFAGEGGAARLSLRALAPTSVQKFIFGQDTVTVAVTLSTRKTDTVYVVDTLVDTIAPPPTIKSGQVFGPSGLVATTTGIAPYGWTVLPGGSGASVLAGLRWAAANNIKAKINLPGGSHSSSEDGTGPNLSIINDTLRFDPKKWHDRVDAVFSTPGVKDSLLKYWSKGLVSGFSVMDEPHVSGLGDGNTWGPRGTMTKVRVDSLCQYIKNKIPSIPVGVDHQAQAFEPDKNYKVCDFVVNQWSVRTGDRKQWVAFSDSVAKRQGTQTLYSINWRNGGAQDRDGVWDCGGAPKGQSSPNCAMTPDTVKASLLHLGTLSRGGMMMWNYDAATATRNQVVSQAVADSLKKIPYKPLKRR